MYSTNIAAVFLERVFLPCSPQVTRSANLLSVTLGRRCATPVYDIRQTKATTAHSTRASAHSRRSHPATYACTRTRPSARTYAPTHHPHPHPHTHTHTRHALICLNCKKLPLADFQGACFFAGKWVAHFFGGIPCLVGFTVTGKRKAKPPNGGRGLPERNSETNQQMKSKLHPVALRCNEPFSCLFFRGSSACLYSSMESLVVYFGRKGEATHHPRR